MTISSQHFHTLNQTSPYNSILSQIPNKVVHHLKGVNISRHLIHTASRLAIAYMYRDT